MMGISIEKNSLVIVTFEYDEEPLIEKVFNINT
jgi:hypothetical protein